VPHWHQDGGTYFVSFRLADSIPQERLREWAAEREGWVTRNPPPWSVEQEPEYHERFTARIETWCDQGMGSCALRQLATRKILSDSLTHFDGERYTQHALVVMPNHVHVLFSLLGNHALADVVKSWKTFTSREIHRLTEASGTFWMKDYFDRLVRDTAHFWRCARYIRRNPEKARLAAGDYTLFEAPLVREQLDSERSGGFPAAVQNGRLGSRPSA
jgi:REP element-mobilizing transposase RayT